jgi:hypothetical protein
MCKKELFKILTKYMSAQMAYSCLQGRRRPIYDVMCVLEDKEGISLSIWRDINSFIENSTKEKQSGQELRGVAK